MLIFVAVMLLSSGCASASSVTGQGSAIHYKNSNEKAYDTWYILNQNSKESTLIFTNKIYVNGKYVLNEKMTVDFLTISPTELKVTTKGYADGQLARTCVSYYHATHSASYNAKANEPALVSHLIGCMC
jgi:hypothetical protein